MMPLPPPLLDIDTLLDGSEPRQCGGFWYVVGLFLLMVMVGSYISHKWPNAQNIMHLVSGLVMVGIFTAMSVITGSALKRQRAEQQQLEAAEELMQLRRWDDAARTLESFLQRPPRLPGARIQGLIFLTSILARYHRFEDAIRVHNYILENVRLDPNTNHAIRLGRAMAMLREDHLFDADRAIAELRRAGGSDSAGLALIEIYRDVKTGHPAEAIDIFNKRLDTLRRQLGHRIGDAYALIARAYDLLGQDADARLAYQNATLLTPVSELNRRYPEVITLFEKYGATPAPREAA